MTHLPGHTSAHSIEPGGVLMLAQERDSFLGSFDEQQSMTGYIDEFRVWSKVRTSTEIRAHFEVSITVTPYPKPLLLLSPP